MRTAIPYLLLGRRVRLASEHLHVLRVRHVRRKRPAGRDRDPQNRFFQQQQQQATMQALGYVPVPADLDPSGT
jgi:hypothetical protein